MQDSTLLIINEQADAQAKQSEDIAQRVRDSIERHIQEQVRLHYISEQCERANFFATASALRASTILERARDLEAEMNGFAERLSGYRRKSQP